MTNQTYQVNRITGSLDGPWLLHEKDLRKLDAILNEYWAKFELRRERLLRNDTNEYKRKFKRLEDEHREEFHKQVRDYRETSVYSKSSRMLYINVQGGAPYRGSTFDQAFRASGLLNRRVTGFTVEMVSGDIVCNVRVELSFPSQSLAIEVSPEDVLEAEELYSTVYEWAKEIRRRVFWQWVWGRIAKHSGKILIAGVLLYILLFFLAQNDNVEGIRRELFDLHDGGITNDNMAQAVDLLVRLQRNELILTPRLIAYPFGLLYLAIVLYFRPKVVIGIGRGRDDLFLWKLWPVLALAPPVAFLTDILWPYIAELIKNFLFLIR